MFKTPLQQVIQFDKYAKWLPELQRRETWEETVQRVLGFFEIQLINQGKPIHHIPWAELETAMLNLDVMPSMRIVQMAGPALERCHVGGYNCAYTTLESPTDLAELLYILMQGTGVGYSVEQKYISKWPQVVGYENKSITSYWLVEDSTEGWCEAFKHAIICAINGEKVEFNYSSIRPEGAWLRTKGGRASGSKPLEDLLTKTRQIIRNRSHGIITPFDIHRLACLAGQIVHVGGIRRSALISLFDRDDTVMRNCKNGNEWFAKYPELSQANNSAVYEQNEIIQLDEWNQLATSGSGEPGIFRRPVGLANRFAAEWGTNPCGEIILRPKQFCNLSQAVARPGDTYQELAKKVRLATIFGTIQATLTNFSYLRPTWKANCEEERLLGVDITGVADCEYFKQLDSGWGKSQLRNLTFETNYALSKNLSINPSVSTTCNKPSGNSSQLLDCASGIHTRYAPYYIRRIRLGQRTALADYLRSVGVKNHELDHDRITVFEFPVASPKGSPTRNDWDANTQFWNWFYWKRNWTTHNPSCTIYVKPGEWRNMFDRLIENWSLIGGISFLPKDDHVYQLAPYEEIDEVEYNKRMREFPPLDLSLVVEKIDNTTMAQDYACEGDKCLWEPK